MQNLNSNLRMCAAIMDWDSVRIVRAPIGEGKVLQQINFHCETDNEDSPQEGSLRGNKMLRSTACYVYTLAPSSYPQTTPTDHEHLIILPSWRMDEGTVPSMIHLPSSQGSKHGSLSDGWVDVALSSAESVANSRYS